MDKRKRELALVAAMAILIVALVIPRVTLVWPDVVGPGVNPNLPIPVFPGGRGGGGGSGSPPIEGETHFSVEVTFSDGTTKVYGVGESPALSILRGIGRSLSVFDTSEGKAIQRFRITATLTLYYSGVATSASMSGNVNIILNGATGLSTPLLLSQIPQSDAPIVVADFTLFASQVQSWAAGYGVQMLEFSVPVGSVVTLNFTDGSNHPIWFDGASANIEVDITATGITGGDIVVSGVPSDLPAQGLNYATTYWHFETFYTPDSVLHRDFQKFANDGFQYVCFNIHWSYLESSRGVYNAQYIDDLKRAAGIAGQYGLEVMFDFHTLMHDNSYTMPTWLNPRNFEAVVLNTNGHRADWMNMLAYTVNELDVLTNIHSWHMMNEPYRGWGVDATIAEWKLFWSECKATFNTHSSRPVSIRFASDSLVTSTQFDYDLSIFDSSDYWSVTWYPQYSNEATLRWIVQEAQNAGKQLVVAEYGDNSDNDQVQAASYVVQLDLFAEVGVNIALAWGWKADYDSTNPWPNGMDWNLAEDDQGNPRPAYDIILNYIDTGPAPGSLNVQRYESMYNYENYSPLAPNDGIGIATEVDIYESYWYGTENNCINDMHAAGKKVLQYYNYMAKANTSSGYDPAWTLRDSAGDIIYATGWPQNKLMDPLNQGWRDYSVNWLNARLAEGFDGVFADNGVDVNFPDDYHVNARAINPRTGSAYTDSQWVTDRLDFINYVKTQTGAFMIANGLWSGYKYQTYQIEARRVVDNVLVDGLFFEGPFGQVSPGMFWSVGDWTRSVDVFMEMQTRWLDDPSKILVIWTQPRVSGDYDHGGTVGVIGRDQAAKYLYASSLMGISVVDQNYVGLHNHMSDPDSQALYALPLTEPQGDYTVVPGTNGDVFTRRFGNGLVMVNPSQNTYDLNVDPGFVDAQGTLVTSLTLDAYMGEMLFDG